MNEPPKPAEPVRPEAFNGGNFGWVIHERRVAEYEAEWRSHVDAVVAQKQALYDKGMTEFAEQCDSLLDAIKEKDAEIAQLTDTISLVSGTNVTLRARVEELEEEVEEWKAEVSAAKDLLRIGRPLNFD